MYACAFVSSPRVMGCTCVHLLFTGLVALPNESYLNRTHARFWQCCTIIQPVLDELINECFHICFAIVLVVCIDIVFLVFFLVDGSGYGVASSSRGRRYVVTTTTTTTTIFGLRQGKAIHLFHFIPLFDEQALNRD